jgi:hypothetical protein
MRASGQREIIIDLRAVFSRDSFQRELARHFPIAADHSELWSSFSKCLAEGLPGRLPPLRLLGWDDFKRRMPRYARRIKRILKGLWYKPVPD